MIRMKKDDLVRLKASFDCGCKYSQYVGGDGPVYDELSYDQIISMSNSEVAVNSSIKLMRDMILFLSNRDISYNGIAICPIFSIFVNNDYIDKNGNIVSMDGILDDYVGISFDMGYVYSKKNYSKVFQISEVDDNEDIFYCRFSDFVIGLNECGFELERISNFRELSKLVFEGKQPVGKIPISFKTSKLYNKK